MRAASAYLVAMVLLVGGASTAYVLAGPEDVLTIRSDDHVRPGMELSEMKQQLIFGLRPRLQTEFRFINRVVALVRSGKLRVDMVASTFDWARRKEPYPFPFFERALRIRAAEIGVKI